MSDENMPRCFVIMPISDQQGYPAEHFTKIYEQIFIPAIEEAGYKPDRVDGDNICDSIIHKIFERIQNCEMALCDLSSRNPNVLYELGLRQAYNKPVVLVKDERTEKIFDVGGINTIQYDSDRLYENVLASRKKITQALIETRDGNNYSLIKIVKANEAKFPEGDLPGNEKTEIMLQQIMSELNQIKQYGKIDNKIVYESFLKDKNKFIKNNSVRIVIEENIRELEAEVFNLKEYGAKIPNSKLKEFGRKINIIELNLEHQVIDPNERIFLYSKLEPVKDTLIEFTRNNLE